jgi:hypothetical protein
MKVTVSQRIRIALPEGTPRTVLHVLLTPRSGPSQSVSDWHITPPPDAEIVSFTDAFGNLAHLIAQAKPPKDWSVSVAGTVETQDRSGVLGRLPGDPVSRLYLRKTPLTRLGPELVDPFREQAAGPDRVGLFHTVMARTPATLRLAGRGKPAAADKGRPAQKPEQPSTQTQSQTATLTAPASTTRPAAPDLAHTFIGIARELGIPARYVTGYLARDTATAPAMHAWAEVFDEGMGWIGFDPLLQLCPTDTHVRVAVGLDAHTAAPVRSVPVPLTPPAAMLEVMKG